MYLFLILTLVQTKTEYVDISDLYSGAVFTAITLSEKTIWVGLEGRGQGRSDKLYLFDHVSRRVQTLPCDSIKLDLYSRLIPMSTGFALIEGGGAVCIFDDEGDFQEKYYLNSLKGFPSNIRLLEAQHKQDSVVSLTFRDLEQYKDLFMGILDVEKREFEITTFKHDFDDDGYWLYRNNTWYFLNTTNGEIAELDKHYLSKKILVPKMEPILVVPEKKLSDMLRQQGNSPYLHLLKGCITRGNTTTFWRFHEKSKGGPILHQLVLNNGNFTVVSNSRLVLAKFDNVVLEFDNQEQEYSLKSKP